MQNTRQIKQRIGTAKNIAKITKAMEMVSASKMRKAQDQAFSTRPYSQALRQSLQMLAANADITSHPLLSEHAAGKPVCVLVSTDKGLCGSMNSNLFKKAIEWYENHPTGSFIMIGRKSVAYATLMGLPIHAQFIDLPVRPQVADITGLSRLVIDGFLAKEFRSVTIIFTDFVSTLVQKVAQQQILPLPKDSVSDVGQLVKSPSSEYVFEPSASQILDTILPFFVENTIYQALLESRASEHSSRMVSMKNASDNAGELMKDLQLVFNKSRQAAITSELLDISTAMLSQS